MSRSRSRGATVFAVALVLLYGLRAGLGWVAGPAYSQGRRLAAAGRYEEALPYLDRAAAGMNRPAARWLAGEVRLGLRYDRQAAGATQEETEELLERAAADYTAAIAASPASGWYWAGLGQVFHQIERTERHRHGVPLAVLEADPWDFVGRPGRIAVGLSRMAVEREPAVFTFHDQLALILLDYDLDPPAFEAVRRAARAQPIFHLHQFRNLRRIPPELLASFAEGSRQALGSAPLLRPVSHRIALGRVELSRSEYALAEADLRAALAEPGSRLERAEAQYYLGLALARQQRFDEALEMLEQAKRHPDFVAGAVEAEARIARQQGRLEDALELYREARRLMPRRVDIILQFARIARDLQRWDQAIQALNWGRIVAPGATAPRVELVETFVAKGEIAAAWRALREVEGALDPATVERLRRGIQRRQATGSERDWSYKKADSADANGPAGN